MDEEFKLTLGDKIRAVRRARGLTQEELASKIGIRGYQISGYESGRNLPSLTTFEWICKALDISASKLLGF